MNRRPGSIPRLTDCAAVVHLVELPFQRVPGSFGAVGVLEVEASGELVVVDLNIVSS